jgi:PAS domain S-box-containing protein
VIAEYRDVYGGGIWIYDENGELLESAHDNAPLDAVLESARLGALGEERSYVLSDLRTGGWIVAARPLVGRGNAILGIVVTASSADQSASILKSVRDRLWATFWTSLIVAGLLGFAFSEILARRLRALSKAAAAIEAGDFAQRLSTTLVPGEIQDLAVSYNSMASKLGEAFSAIKGSQLQIAAVVQSMAEGVLSLDSQSMVRVANPEAARLLGMHDRDLTDVSIETITDNPDVLDMVHRSLAGERSAQTVQFGRSVVLLHGTPLLDPTGTIDGAVMLLADVSERHRFEDAQRRFVADASHEMRTPIAALKGMLELLIDGAQNDPEVRSDFLGTMQTEVDRLGRLVADLLTLAQLEAGNLELRINPETAVELLGDVAGVMHTLAEQSEVTIAVEAPDTDVRVLADRDRVVQVLLSFTDNALKHSPAGSTIHLRAQQHPDGVLLAVSDEGPGIEPDEISRVFERFYRADSSRSGGGGTGLGLAIAKEIIEAHGSDIQVESTPATGTTFGFELPKA